jgi:hypothetical protein
MTIEIWIGKDFDYTYEREALDLFVNDLESCLGNTDTLYVVLADYYIDGRQVDLTVLKRDAIITIELKECREPFEASENGDWLTPSAHLIGTQDLNPFQQVRQYRNKWFNLLKRNKDRFRCLATAQDDRPFWNVTGIVTISPTLHPDTENKISSSIWWFKLCGLDELCQKIVFQTNRWMNFSDEELRNIAIQLLSLKQNSYVDKKKIKERDKKQSKQNVNVEHGNQGNDSANNFSTHRSLIAGCTDYSYLTLEVIMNDLDRWLKRLIQVQEYLNKSTQKLKEASYWSNVSISVKSIFEKSTTFHRTSIKEITEIISEIQSEIQNHHVSRLRRICQVATELNYEYGQIWHGEDNFKEYGNPHFRVLEGMYAEGRDMSVSLLDLGNAAERLSDFVGKKY